MGLAKLHFIDAKLALDTWRTSAYLAPLADDNSGVLWPEAKVSADLKSHLTTTPASDATFAPLPAPAMRACLVPRVGQIAQLPIYMRAPAPMYSSATP